MNGWHDKIVLKMETICQLRTIPKSSYISADAFVAGKYIVGTWIIQAFGGKIVKREIEE